MILIIGTEVIDVSLEDQFENEILVNVIFLSGQTERVSKERKTGKRKIVLTRLVQKEGQSTEDDPQSLPTRGGSQLPKKVSTQASLLMTHMQEECAITKVSHTENRKKPFKIKVSSVHVIVIGYKRKYYELTAKAFSYSYLPRLQLRCQKT